MASIYANQVQEYGHRWHWPWLAFLFLLTLFWALNGLMRDNINQSEVICTQGNGSRFRPAVEMDGLIWTADIDAALACGLKHDCPVLVAFHAITDCNARKNEINVFRQHRVKSAMRRYVLVMLETDYVPEQFYVKKPDDDDSRKDGEANLNFEVQHFSTVQEPLYAVLQPQGDGNFKILGQYEGGLIDKPLEFIRFLSDPGAAH